MTPYDWWKTTDPDEEAAEREETRCALVQDLVTQYLEDPAKVAEADRLRAGTMPGEHYSDVERVLADLYSPAPGSTNNATRVSLGDLSAMQWRSRYATLHAMAVAEVDRMGD
jgi:hypothetical protein